METRFPSPTHQLGGDVLGEAHGSDAIRADHQQRDDDVDKGQPVGEVGPVGRALGQQSWIHAPTLRPVTPSCQQLLPAPNPPLAARTAHRSLASTPLWTLLLPLSLAFSPQSGHLGLSALPQTVTGQTCPKAFALPVAAA